MHRLLPFYIQGGTKHEVIIAFIVAFANALVLGIYAAVITLAVRLVS
jgi:hypothetical protein